MTEIGRVLQQELMKSAATECASSILFAPKKDGSFRLYVENRIPNAVPIRHFYLLLSIDKCIDLLGDVRIFSTLDASSAYSEVKIGTRDSEKTHLPLVLTLPRNAGVTLKLKCASFL